MSEVPDGALSIADNIVIDRESLAESRRGFTPYGQALDIGLDGTINQLFDFKDTLLVHYDSKIARDSDNLGTWVNYSGTIDAPTGSKMRSTQSNRNLYVTTTAGIKKLDSITGNFVKAGVPQSLDSSFSLQAGTTLGPNKIVAYRTVWTYTDANKNLIVGVPSQRLIVDNTSATDSKDAQLTVTIPSEVNSDFTLQVFRTAIIDNTIEPNDEMQLVVEQSPDGTDITNGYMVILDQMPDSLKGVTLYTSPSQEGIAEANYQPPLCKDITLFKNSVLYANTKSKHRLYWNLVSTGEGGLDSGMEVTIAGSGFMGATGSAPSGGFLIMNTGDPAYDNEQTARNIVAAVNATISPTICAFYISGYDDIPGKMLFENINVESEGFSAGTDADGIGFNPTNPQSDNDEALNRVYISKALEPEAVPLGSYLDVGSADDPILRILALRDSVFVLKTDGVFRIVGESRSNFSVSLFDNTTKVIAPEAAVITNNQVVCMTDQAVAAISDTGVQVLSRPIERGLIELSSSLYPNFASATHAVSYESERKYILFTIHRRDDQATRDSTTYAEDAFVYNFFTSSWTHWMLNTPQISGTSSTVYPFATCSMVNSRDNKLYFGHPTSGYVYSERKTYTADDYADESYVKSIGTVVGRTLSIAPSINTGWVGYTIEQGSSRAIIESIPNTNTAVIATDTTFTTGPCTIYKPIQVAVRWTPQYGDNPTMMKHFSEAVVFFREASFDTVDIGFDSSWSVTPEYTTVSAYDSGTWGSFPWSTVAWGGADFGTQQALRTYVPLEKARCMWINTSVKMKEAFKAFSLAGVSLTYTNMSTKWR